MGNEFTDILGQLAAGRNLAFEQMTAAIGAMMRGDCRDEQIALFLTALRAKGETTEEVAGAAAAMRQHMTPINSQRQGVVNTCGTGGDGSGTFNISTAAALVTAAAGVPVAKHGNRSITSKTGSADVLAELGVNIDAPVPVVERCLNDLGICFCFAPQLHPAMKHVAAVRRSLGVPTIFNLLGPLCNPAAAPFQLLGVGRSELRDVLSAALSRLDTTRALVVCGDDGLDEVTLAATTQVSEVAKTEIREFSWEPDDFGLTRASLDVMVVDGPSASAAMIKDVLAGVAGPPRDIVVLNAAAAIWTAKPETPPALCAASAAEAIDSGAARERLEQLAQASNS